MLCSCHFLIVRGGGLEILTTTSIFPCPSLCTSLSVSFEAQEWVSLFSFLLSFPEHLSNYHKIEATFVPTDQCCYLLLYIHHFKCQSILIVFLFFFRSRTLLLARRTCLRRKHFCGGPRKQPTSTPESMSKTSLSHGGTVSPSMPSSTETGAQKLSQPSYIWNMD